MLRACVGGVARGQEAVHADGVARPAYAGRAGALGEMCSVPRLGDIVAETEAERLDRGVRYEVNHQHPEDGARLVRVYEYIRIIITL